jgi:uncharacterized membrane protein
MTWGRVLLWAVLGISLLANAVVLGLVLRLGAFRDDGAGLRSVWSGVPAETRADFRAGIAANRAELRRLLGDLRQARTEMLAAAAARPYDREAVVIAQGKVRAATEALQVRTQALMLETFDRAAGAAPSGSP